MQSARILILFVAALLTQSVAAERPPSSTPSPFGRLQRQLDALAVGKLQAQLDALEARTKALEDSAPDSSVDGRTYCFVLNLSIMRGDTRDKSEELQTNVIRRTATFSGGVFTGWFLSNVLNNQKDDGTVLPGLGDPIDPLMASYIQTGNKLDMDFLDMASGLVSSANWYVSKDGSVIHGSTISQLSVFGPPGFPPVFPPVRSFGFVRNWTLVETDPVPFDNCDAEDQ